MDKLGRLLNLDIGKVTESILGEPYDSNPDTLDLYFYLCKKYSEAKRGLLLANNDSTYESSIERYIDILKDLNFIEIFEGYFINKNEEEILQVHFNYELGILLVFDSFNGLLNSSKYYFNWIPNATFPSYINLFDEPTILKDGKDKWLFYGGNDCREAIKYKINILKEEGKFLKPWKVSPKHFNLVTFTKKEQGSKEHLTKQRLNRLPEEARKIINICIEE